MITDPKELKKTVLILSEIFNIAFEIRGNAVASTYGETAKEKIDDYISYAKEEYSWHFGLDHGPSSGWFKKDSIDNIQLYSTKTLGHYEWNILNFFKAAAQPVVKLSVNLHEEEYYDDLNEVYEDSSEYLKSMTRTKDDVEKDAQLGMEKLNTFINSL